MEVGHQFHLKVITRHLPLDLLSQNLHMEVRIVAPKPACPKHHNMDQGNLRRQHLEPIPQVVHSLLSHQARHFQDIRALINLRLNMGKAKIIIQPIRVDLNIDLISIKVVNIKGALHPRRPQRHIRLKVFRLRALMHPHKVDPPHIRLRKNL